MRKENKNLLICSHQRTDMKLHAKVSQDQLLAMVEESMFGMSDGGFCMACGEEAMNVEPDAVGYECESCEESQVFGAEQLLLLTQA